LPIYGFVIRWTRGVVTEATSLSVGSPTISTSCSTGAVVKVAPPVDCGRTNPRASPANDTEPGSRGASSFRRPSADGKKRTRRGVPGQLDVVYISVRLTMAAGCEGAPLS